MGEYTACQGNLTFFSNTPLLSNITEIDQHHNEHVGQAHPLPLGDERHCIIINMKNSC